MRSLSQVGKIDLLDNVKLLDSLSGSFCETVSPIREEVPYYSVFLFHHRAHLGTVNFFDSARKREHVYWELQCKSFFSVKIQFKFVNFDKFWANFLWKCLLFHLTPPTRRGRFRRKVWLRWYRLVHRRPSPRAELINRGVGGKLVSAKFVWHVLGCIEGAFLHANTSTHLNDFLVFVELSKFRTPLHRSCFCSSCAISEKFFGSFDPFLLISAFFGGIIFRLGSSWLFPSWGSNLCAAPNSKFHQDFVKKSS